MKIVQEEITDRSIEVGSGCQWIGQGSEPQWNNPKSMKAYDHIESYHGPKRKSHRFIGRAGGTNTDQGQWFDEKDWIEAEKFIPQYPGRYVIDFERSIGRVYHPDGNITENVTRAFIRRNFDGTLDAGYPVVDSFVFE